MRRRSNRWILVTGLSAMALALVAASPALAEGTRAAAPVTGFARAGHFAPGKGPVDLLVDGKVAAKGLTYKHVTPYLAVPAGPHSFVLRTPEGKVVLRAEAGIPANGAVTIGAVTTRAGLAGNVYDDHLQTPKPGTALVRFVHTAPAAAKVDISIAGGQDLANNVGYPSATPYRAIKAGTYDINVRSVATKKLLLHITKWTAAPGSQSSVVLVNTTKGTLDAVPFTDSAMAPAAPKGAAATGLGGTAPKSAQSGPVSAPIATLLATAVLAAGAAGVFTLRRRRVG
ncbi:MAG: DUF4397 domain-containing protein [Actinomycetota bacterium]|nr:DUF4397 domain-containing protein [Actinomycetota bacterium]